MTTRLNISVPDHLAEQVRAQKLRVSAICQEALARAVVAPAAAKHPGRAPDMAEPFDEWAILELLGHRRIAGRVTEQQIAGAPFLRVDIPGEPEVTQYVAPGSVYAIHPTTEEIVRSVAARFRPAPVQRWELAPVVEARAEPYEDATYEGGAF